jgi:hypothetical protein
MARGGAGAAPYTAAIELLRRARGSWNTIDGRLILAGNPGGIDGLNLRQLLNVTYTVFTENLQEKDRAEFDAMLEGEVPLAAAAPVPQERNVNALMGAFGMGAA